jgi:outer membrane protein TolC
MIAATALVVLPVGAQPLPHNPTPHRIQHTWVGDLTLDQAITLALRQNPTVLKALWSIEQTRGEIIEVRAEALPHLTVTSSYYAQSKSLANAATGAGASNSSASSSPNVGSQIQQQLAGIPGLSPSIAKQVAQTVQSNIAQAVAAANSNSPTLNDQSWNVQVQGSQVIYAGGQVAAAINIAKFAEASAYFSLRDTIDQIIDTTRQQFYTVLLNRALIKVQEESVKLLQDQLKDQQNRFEAGTVPRFNVLQAEVALANQQPQLISARNAYVISEYQLARTLDIDPGKAGQTTYNAVGQLEVFERPLGLRNAIQMGIEHRPFLKVQRLLILSTKEQVKVALAGYKPQINAVGGFQERNVPTSDRLDDVVNGWFFGVYGTWNIFDGLQTYGAVKAARAQLESARVNYDDAVHQVAQEVEQAYANVQTARETIRSQQKVVEEALEALRLATERLAAGAGVQLDVLNAQVALTQARTTDYQALANYNTALAEFDRVTATSTTYAEAFDDPLLRRVPKDPVIEVAPDAAPPVPTPVPGKKKH